MHMFVYIYVYVCTCACCIYIKTSLVVLVVKNPAADSDSIPGSGRSLGERIGYPLQYSWPSLVAQMVKKLPANAGDVGSSLGLGRSPRGRAWLPNPVFLPGESNGQWSVTGYNP